MRLLQPETPRVCLLMTDHHLGNFVLSLPVIETLAAWFHERPLVVVDERYGGLVRRLPSVGEVLLYPDQSIRRRGVIRNLRPTLFALRLAARRPSVAVDLGGPPRGAWLALASGARRRIGFERSVWRRLYTDRIPYAEATHAFDRYCGFLSMIGRVSRPSWLRLNAPEAVRAALVHRLAREQPHPGAPLLVVHAGAGKAWRCWPEERFAETADRLVRRYGFDVALLAAGAERALAERVRARMQEATSAFLFQGPILELLALLERAALFLGNESGPAHLASLTDCPMVVIFGPSKETIWRPIRQDRCVVLRGAPCDPRCDRSICYASRRCLLALTVEQTEAAARGLLEETRPFPAPR